MLINSDAMSAFEAPRAPEGQDAVYTAFGLHPSTTIIGAEIRNLHLLHVNEATAAQGEQRLKLAIDQIKIPELLVRHSWQRDDIAVWDNLGAVHYGVAGDLRNRKRLLHRVAAWSPEVRPSLDRQEALSALDNR